jgi:DMSO/TMAO reductase YedYZ molybdopterin-dependent catalytic subunit
MSDGSDEKPLDVIPSVEGGTGDEAPTPDMADGHVPLAAPLEEAVPVPAELVPSELDTSDVDAQPSAPASALPGVVNLDETISARSAPRSLIAQILAPEDQTPLWIDPKRLERQTRRDFLLFGGATLAAAAGVWWLLPDGTKQQWLSPRGAAALDSIEARFGATGARREKFLGRVLTFDDDVAEALYSKNRHVRSYRTSDVTALRNNYNGRTPTGEYLPSWSLRLSGLASGKDEVLSAVDLHRLPAHDQVTRLCCVEGWSAIAFWTGIRFADLLRAFPPAPDFRWAAIESAVNLDGAGRPDPYYVSIDLDTARHPQSLLAMYQNRQPLSLAHGAPLRLVVPMKLGLKNIKAITSIRYMADEPRDYWNERGYSKYDGL